MVDMFGRHVGQINYGRSANWLSGVGSGVEQQNGNNGGGGSLFMNNLSAAAAAGASNRFSIPMPPGFQTGQHGSGKQQKTECIN